jgi:hypothetical protein
LFSQPEVVVRGGRVLWTDELRGAPPLALGRWTCCCRSSTWRHAARLDATPPAGGERFTLSARMREPLLSVHNGRWQQWSGQVFASFPGSMSRASAGAPISVRPLRRAAAPCVPGSM